MVFFCKSQMDFRTFELSGPSYKVHYEFGYIFCRFEANATRFWFTTNFRMARRIINTYTGIFLFDDALAFFNNQYIIVTYYKLFYLCHMYDNNPKRGISFKIVREQYVNGKRKAYLYSKRNFSAFIMSDV